VKRKGGGREEGCITPSEGAGSKSKTSGRGRKRGKADRQTLTSTYICSTTIGREKKGKKKGGGAPGA